MIEQINWGVLTCTMKQTTRVIAKCITLKSNFEKQITINTLWTRLYKVHKHTHLQWLETHCWQSLSSNQQGELLPLERRLPLGGEGGGHTQSSQGPGSVLLTDLSGGRSFVKLHVHILCIISVWCLLQRYWTAANEASCALSPWGVWCATVANSGLSSVCGLLLTWVALQDLGHSPFQWTFMSDLMPSPVQGPRFPWKISGHSGQGPHRPNHVHPYQGAEQGTWTSPSSLGLPEDPHLQDVGLYSL